MSCLFMKPYPPFLCHSLQPMPTYLNLIQLQKKIIVELRPFQFLHFFFDKPSIFGLFMYKILGTEGAY